MSKRRANDLDLDYYKDIVHSGFPLFGVEIELEHTDREGFDLYLWNTWCDLFEAHEIQTKLDGSLSYSGGMEFVTPAAQLGWHKTFTRSPVFDVWQNNFDSHRRATGMHVHICKPKDFTFEQQRRFQWKLLRLLNKPDHKAWTKEIAGRAENSYATARTPILQAMLNRDNYYGRYNNIADTGKTYEFRLFQSTHDPETYYSRLCWVYSLWSWAQDNLTSDVNSISNYLNYLKEYNSDESFAIAADVAARAYRTVNPDAALVISI